MYLSFYITDSRNGLIFQYLPSANAPTFSDLWVKMKSVENVDSDISSFYEIKIGKYLNVSRYHSNVNNLNYWCLSSKENDISNGSGTNRIEPLVLLENIDTILMEYFNKDQLTVKKLTNNSDRLTMIFNYIIDDGEPQLSGNLYSNKIKEVIPLQNDFTKIIHSTAKNLSNAVANSSQKKDLRYHGVMSSNTTIMDDNAVPWRTTKFTPYSKEEIYLDFKEKVKLVFQKHGNGKRRIFSSNGYINNELKSGNRSSRMRLVHGSIYGSIEGHSLLNGNMPTIELNLNNNGSNLGIPRFHNCVNIEDYIVDNEDPNLLNTKIKFIPPDGKFHLMDYNINLQNDMSSNDMGLISINFENNLGLNDDEFEITVNINGSSKVSKIKNLVIDLRFFEKMNNNDDNDSSVELPQGKIKILRNTHGRFSHDVGAVTGSWIFDVSTPTGTIAVLRGCIEDVSVSKDTESQESKTKSVGSMILQALNVKYEYEGQLISGIKVNSIDVSKGLRSSTTSNVFKGFKYISEMIDCELREC
ncbi:AP-3 complex subunit mu [Maudiozyma exigua]|uniref:AP-3 complex subunit mu n=1 Tax=Maudiozyma exigua TaxID=34358 RepID=A0A9P6W1G1_MAUEX|nr:AP-3 complex subunit mu [Kazachstania exigua]